MTKMASKIDQKSRLRRGCVFGSFWDGLRASKDLTILVCARPFWVPFSIKNRKNAIQKGIQKSIPKKYRTIMKKASK